MTRPEVPIPHTAVVPAAGLGTRFLPATKTVPKELLPVVDTPGIRQFQLWDVIPTEVAGYLRDLRPYIHQCRYPACTHPHEEPCAVKDAVAAGRRAARSRRPAAAVG